ncbi:MAG: class F sortase [Propionibacteriales bacterium]|nr:class F sortase [Propionibacteriales bacterium]
MTELSTAKPSIAKHSSAKPSTSTPTAQPSRPLAVNPGLPSTLLLPSLGVSAPVSNIGLDSSLTLVPPSDYTTVGLWAQGAEPGARSGTAIITGHTVHTGGGALDNLEQMRPGEQIVVERPRRDLLYTVETVRIYSKGTLAEDAAQVFAQDGPGRLAVVTCEDWDGTTYLSNVVVIATNPRALATRS